jgi:GTP-binding protein HflX
LPPQIERGEHGEPVAVRVSALTGEGLELLRQAIAERLHGFNNDHNIEDRDRYGTE